MMLFKVGDEVRVRQPTNLFHSELGKVVSIDHVKLTYKVIFHRGNSDVYTCFDLILVKRQEEKVMKFKVGDKVKVSNSWYGRSSLIGEISTVNTGDVLPFRVRFENGKYEPFRDTDLELVKEKAEKQAFTKSDLKTGMGVVLRDGSKGHVLLDTDDSDVVRILDNGTWGDLAKYKDDLTSKSREANDIVEVYRSKWSFMYLTGQVFGQECIFKREEPKPEPTKMTMKEINEHFGKAIEIVE